MITVLAYDVGTSGVKTCLFEIDDRIRIIDSVSASYSLHVLPDGGAEQDPDEWWQAIVQTTRQIARDHPEQCATLTGISFCAQMQCLVMVDRRGRPVCPAMSYMDQRASVEMRLIGGKAPRISGVNAGILAKALYHTGAAPASVKDPVWKYHWVRRNKPEAFARAYKWLDAKEAIIARMTGKFVMSHDSAFATLLYDVRARKGRFSPEVMRALHVNPAHMPEIVASTDVVGPLLAEAADELGLPEETPVYAGGGDASLIGVGAGATELHDTHVYMGTSGWVGTVTDKRAVDLSAMIATVVGADPSRYHYFAELETAGKCLEWVKDHLALDEINVYLDKHSVCEGMEARFRSLYDYMSEVISRSEPGAGGVLFTPWLHGNRCPFEDPNARAMFMNVSLNTGKTELMRAVVEGVCYHMRWFIETQEKKVMTSSVVRFVGGGALSDVTAQILADIVGRPVEVTENPQDAGAVGAALLVAVGAGITPTVESARRLVTVHARFEPRRELAQTYARQYDAYRKIYPANKKIFSLLNRG